MEKIIVKILFLLFFAVTFLTSGNVEQVNALAKKIPYSTKSQTAQILHKLENIYINAVVSDDEPAVQKSLKNIIRCQKLLGIDSKTYESELKSLSIKYTNTLPKVKNKPINSALSIKSINKKNNTIIIKFNKAVTKKDLLFFELNNNGQYKDVFDIKAKLNFKKNISLSNINKVKIAQNRSNKVRIVLEDKAKIYSSAFIRSGSLFIEVNKNPNRFAKKIKIQSQPKTIPTPASTPIIRSEKAKYSSKKIIVIDPGHGGKDSGAVGYKKYQEKRTVLKVSRLIRDILKKKGYKVYMTRDSDKFIDLHKRTEFANKKSADLFISIHANASPKSQKLTLKGIETFFLSPARSGRAKRVAAKENSFSVKKMNDMSKNTLLSFLNKNKIVQSNKLAIDIQRGMLTQVRKKYKSIRDGGVREAPFWVLVGAQMPAVLIETGYITNPTEADRLFNPFYQKALAKGIADGINNYFVNN